MLKDTNIAIHKSCGKNLHRHDRQKHVPARVVETGVESLENSAHPKHAKFGLTYKTLPCPLLSKVEKYISLYLAFTRNPCLLNTYC